MGTFLVSLTESDFLGILAVYYETREEVLDLS